MKNAVRAVSLLLCIIMLSCFTAFPSSAADDSYRAYLIGLGFPASYADKLADLHLLHPEWSFEPLQVSELNTKYTWSYCLYMETQENVKRSLISSGSDYTAYRHPTNTTLYDTGWYQASDAAVSYFMDARNFLNEKDIFQFEDLSFSDSVTVAQVESSLAGTFMAGAYLENGKTYAEYIYEVGKELGISPLHLASRMRQEQGVNGTGLQIGGACGDRLWYYYSNNVQYEGSSYVNTPSSGYTEASLTQYNGLYNFYNINAAGTGKFAVLLGAMKEAKTGTESKAAEWGGSGQWDTKWKSIYGGAYKLCKSYIKDYQNTIYLQKFNVDNRSSRNFWGQYMQNIGGALSEARTTFTSLAANDCLDCPYRFLIPVYAGMPDTCPDPAGGSCATYAASDTKYSYINQLDSPATASGVNKYITASADGAGNVTLSGWSVHTYGVTGYEYRIDDGEWKPLTTAHRDDVAAATAAYVNCSSGESINSFSERLDLSRLSSGEHTLVLRGVAAYEVNDKTHIDNKYYLIGVMTITSSGATGALVTVNYSTGAVSSIVSSGSIYKLPSAVTSTDPDTYFAGWRVVSDAASLFLPADGSIMVLDDITLTPVFIDLRMENGAAIKASSANTSLRFTAAISYDGYRTLVSAAGASNISSGMIICETERLGDKSMRPSELDLFGIAYRTVPSNGWSHNAATSGNYYGFSCETDTVYSYEYNTNYSAAGYITIRYSDYSSSTIISAYSAQNNSRSARTVAIAALADKAAAYSASEIEVLTKISQ